MNNTDRTAIKMLVRLREDFQAMRKRMDNRIGRKADGTEQNIEEREFQPDDIKNFISIADAARSQERVVEKMLLKKMKQIPIYNEFLSQVKGCGTISAGWILGEFDIYEASTVSKLWQFCGLNPGLYPAKKRVENKDGSYSYVLTGEMVRGDKLTPGCVAPFNKRLRTALCGVLADCFIKSRSPYRKYYDDYKNRKENSASEIKGYRVEGKAWNDTSKGHRHRAAIRYMIKMFLKDLYVEWRTLEGLPVREPYQEQYLGHKHAA